jgi:putative pyruvate formate lyase activating enzyme
MSTHVPAYLQLPERELRRRHAALDSMLSACRLCAHRCSVDRLSGERGFCRAPSYVVYNSACPHGGEEEPLSGSRGSGTVFFTFCNGRCLFCQNYDISQQARGSVISTKDLAEVYLELQAQGCHNVNFVSPAHFLPQIVGALVIAVEEGFDLPLVYNSNGYDSPEVLTLLDGIIDIYLPDFKFGNARSALRLARLPSYPSIAREAIAEMYRQVGRLETDEFGIACRGLIIRHLVLPNDAAASNIVLEWIAGLDTDIHISLMGQYHPAYRAQYDQDINRRITWQEYEAAKKKASELGLTNVWTQSCFLSSGA